MAPVTSIYIPFVDKNVSAEFIASVFEKNGLAKLSCIAIEPYHSTYVSAVNGQSQYKRVYINVKAWEDTEAAYHFIQQLRKREARIVFSENDWWQIEINNDPEKVLANNVGRNVTVLCEPYEAYDYKQTMKLKSILASFKSTEDIETERDFKSYIHQMDEERAMWFSEYIRLVM